MTTSSANYTLTSMMVSPSPRNSIEYEYTEGLFCFRFLCCFSPVPYPGRPKQIVEARDFCEICVALTTAMVFSTRARSSGDASA